MSQASTYPGRDLEAMAFARNYHAWILDEIHAWLGRRLVEVGAGSGNLSRLLVERGAERILALEPSTEMFAHLAALAQELPVIEAHQGTLGSSGLAGDGSWDSVVYINVLEHIADDAQELRLAHAALRPEGSLIVFVPALEWLYSDFDRSVGHYRRYRRAPLEALVRAAGFEVLRCRYFDVAGILPWWIAMVLLRGGLSPASVSLYDHLVVPVMRRVERFLPPPTGKNLLLVARKRAAMSPA